MSFKTPDGKEFKTKKEWKKHYRSLLKFEKVENKNDLVRKPGIVNGNPFDLYKLKKCTVMVLDHIAEVKCDEVEDSKIFIGPTKSSVFIRDCNRCEFTVACKQLRTRNCHDCKIHLFAGTDPIVETSTNIVMSRFNGAYPKLEEHFKKVGLNPLQNHWRRVFDFTPSTTDKPNWSLSDEYTLWSIEGAKNPVPMTSGDDIKDPVDGALDGMKSFSFNTSQADAQKILQKATQEKAPAPPVVPTATTTTTTTATTVTPVVPTASSTTTTTTATPATTESTATSSTTTTTTTTATPAPTLTPFPS